MSMDKRSVEVKFHVTPHERELINQKMAIYGTQKLGVYLRKMAIDGYCVRLDLPEIRELIMQLRKYGTNLNQLAKRANEGGSIFAADLETLSANHAHLFAITSELLKKLLKL